MGALFFNTKSGGNPCSVLIDRSRFPCLNPPRVTVNIYGIRSIRRTVGYDSSSVRKVTSQNELRAWNIHFHISAGGYIPLHSRAYIKYLRYSISISSAYIIADADNQLVCSNI